MYIICYINSWPILRLPNIVCRNCTFSGIFEQPDFFGATTMRFLYYYFTLMPALIEVVLALNRYSAIVKNLTYLKIWKKMLIPSMIAIIVFPIPFAIPAYINPSISKYNDDANHYYYSSGESKFQRAVTLAGFEGVSSIVVVITGIATFRALRKHTNVKHRAVEVKLFIHAMLNFVILLLISTYGVFYAFFHSRWLEMHSFEVQAYLMDIACFGSLYAMLACNSHVRKHLLTTIGLRRTLKISPFMTVDPRGRGSTTMAT